jgi:hypothetical protein
MGLCPLVPRAVDANGDASKDAPTVTTYNIPDAAGVFSNAMPLIMTYGWSGSVFKLLKTVGPAFVDEQSADAPLSLCGIITRLRVGGVQRLDGAVHAIQPGPPFRDYCNTRRRVASNTATLNGFCKMAAALSVDFGSTA